MADINRNAQPTSSEYAGMMRAGPTALGGEVIPQHKQIGAFQYWGPSTAGFVGPCRFGSAGDFPKLHLHIISGADYSAEHGGLFTIELTRGTRWDQAAEIIDRRECHTESLDAAIAEARHWFVQAQKSQPQRGATHYRVIGDAGPLIGGLIP